MIISDLANCCVRCKELDLKKDIVEDRDEKGHLIEFSVHQYCNKQDSCREYQNESINIINNKVFTQEDLNKLFEDNV